MSQEYMQTGNQQSILLKEIANQNSTVSEAIQLQTMKK
jgi:hypothetical protein